MFYLEILRDTPLDKPNNEDLRLEKRDKIKRKRT